MSSLPRLKVSACGHYLATQDGQPFFYLADTCWELFHRCDLAEATLLLDDRAAKGFTAIQAVALAELDGLNTPNSLGERPLIDNDPTRPNEAYFAHVDAIVRLANERGLYLALLPTWGDKYNKQWGQGPEVFTPENARVFGEFLGRRYREAGIIWVLGGDRPLDHEGHLQIVRAMAEGLHAGDGGAHLQTFHPMGGFSSSVWVHNEGWLDFHMIQSGHRRDRDNYNMIEHDFRRMPYRPVIEGEPGYEDHPNSFNVDNGWLDHHDVRKSLYWALLSGAAGYTYGCHDIWQMFQAGRSPISWARTPWKQALHFIGSSQVQYGKRLMLARPYFDRMPDPWMVHANQQTASNMPRAARAKDGSYAFIYVPEGQQIHVTCVPLRSAQLRASWFNPRDGKFTEVGLVDKAEKVTFAPPPYDVNGRDWVLVLDDPACNYPLEA